MPPPACWCKNPRFEQFSKDYAKYSACGTLVSCNPLPADQVAVSNDDIDFYGKKYWLDHQKKELGFPDIYTRSRNDLTERNLHWLKTLLKYCLPQTSVLEIGCAHGSFVALMNLLGFVASGVEMSPWVVEYGKKTFGIQIQTGVVESLDIPAGSLDAIVMMDVLEHLPDPEITMRHCIRLLKPNGILLIQTPQFRENMLHADLVQSKHVFLDQLKTEEHLFLFSERTVTMLFRQLGISHINFEPAIFAHYDMFFAVSRTPFITNNPDEIEACLLAMPQGRFVQALLDIRNRELESEQDRAARWEQIQTLTKMVHESEQERAAMHKRIASLTTNIRKLYSHRSFRILQKLSNWTEISNLTHQIDGNHE
ncbi:MAG: class I SAM-dependent methyltransferase [Chlorobium sp.]|uniref:class I SAM-dependent methyltransferase n=1 Tax=Chlorobium sp. TaxID=1095 RepID=UPI0025BD65DB|nr:class I SAM-dependent methyltransferase [Chlorobium sp.]MCF8383979.1 class I SAM-dependent methyltransferase [Chlorobium sp.]